MMTKVKKQRAEMLRRIERCYSLSTRGEKRKAEGRPSIETVRTNKKKETEDYTEAQAILFAIEDNVKCRR